VIEIHVAGLRESMAYSESAERFAAAEHLRGRSGGAGAVERAELPTPMATLMTAADAQR